MFLNTGKLFLIPLLKYLKEVISMITTAFLQLKHLSTKTTVAHFAHMEKLFN